MFWYVYSRKFTKYLHGTSSLLKLFFGQKHSKLVGSKTTMYAKSMPLSKYLLLCFTEGIQLYRFEMSVWWVNNHNI